MKSPLLIGVLVALFAGGGGFYGGMKYSETRSSSTFTDGGNRQEGQGLKRPRDGRQVRFGNRVGGGDVVSGEILSKDDKSVTLKLRDGGSKIIFFGSTTEVGKLVNGGLSDLSIGTNVFVSGKANEDGSVVAQSIQIRPAPRQQPSE